MGKVQMHHKNENKACNCNFSTFLYNTFIKSKWTIFTQTSATFNLAFQFLIRFHQNYCEIFKLSIDALCSPLSKGVTFQRPKVVTGSAAWFVLPRLLPREHTRFKDGRTRSRFGRKSGRTGRQQWKSEWVLLLLIKVAKSIKSNLLFFITDLFLNFQVAENQQV